MITVRHPKFDFDTLPRDWIAGSRVATWYGNAGHVFIPVGEQFFIDTVRSFRDRITDPGLQAEVRAFIGQEAVHRRTHQQLWDLLRSRGVPVDAYEHFIDRVRSVERFVPPTVRLSVTAALEHYTAAFGVAFLTEDLADAVPPEMARLLAWHGLEELEHRSVAFDVLQVVDDRYVVRVGGFVIATVMLTIVPTVGVVMVGLRDRRDDDECDGGGLVAPTARRDLAAMTARFLGSIGRHAVDYLRPGFHPDELSLPAEAEAWAAGW